MMDSDAQNRESMQALLELGNRPAVVWQPAPPPTAAERAEAQRREAEAERHRAAELERQEREQWQRRLRESFTESKFVKGAWVHTNGALVEDRDAYLRSLDAQAKVNSRAESAWFESQPIGG